MIRGKPEAAPVTKLVRIITPMTDSFVARLDREWHRRQLPSRSETIRTIIEEALDRVEKP